MDDNLIQKVSAFGERLKNGSGEMSRRLTAGMTSMSFKVKELFQGQNQAEKLVEEATAETLQEPDWATNLEICDMINSERVNSVELMRGVKKRIMLKSPMVQYLTLVLLETCVKNCEKAFSEVAAERILDEMVKLIDDPHTILNNRKKALTKIEAWGECGDELRYLPCFEETYKSLKSRGIRFPVRGGESQAPIFTPSRSVAELETPPPAVTDYGAHVLTFTTEQMKEAFDVARNSVELLSTVLSSSSQEYALQDDLTITLVQQCRQSQLTVQRIIERAGDDEVLLFEALNVNDDTQKILSKYEELKTCLSLNSESAMIPVAVEPDFVCIGKDKASIRKPIASWSGREDEQMMLDLDEMVFGKAASSQEQSDPKKQQQDDLISF